MIMEGFEDKVNVVKARQEIFRAIANGKTLVVISDILDKLIQEAYETGFEDGICFEAGYDKGVESYN